MLEIKVLVMAIITILFAIDADAIPYPCNSDETCYLLGKYDIYGAAAVHKKGNNYHITLDDGTTIIGTNAIGAIAFNRFGALLDYSCYGSNKEIITELNAWCDSDEQTAQYIKERVINYPASMKIGRFLPDVETVYSIHSVRLVEKGKWLLLFYKHFKETEEEMLQCDVYAGKFEFNYGLTDNIKKQIRRCIE